jgi:hypothetical protein
MPQTLPVVENFDQYREHFIGPTLNHLLGLGMVLKKYRCNKAFRNFRTALAVSNALTDPEWFMDRYNFRTLRDYLDGLIERDLESFKRTPEKFEKRNQISWYANNISGCLYDIQARINSGRYGYVPITHFFTMDRIAESLLT